MKRRAAVEPSIGHLKNEHRLERNRLKCVAGDAINAVLAAAAMNFHKLLGALWRIFLCYLLAWPSGRGFSSCEDMKPSILNLKMLEINFFRIDYIDT